MKKKLIAVALSLTALLITACAEDQDFTNTSPEQDITETINLLNSATKIKADKALFSVGDEWEITADENKVGKVKGEFIYLIGDTYSLYTPSGNLVGSETENFRIPTATADIYNKDGEKTGHISKALISLLMHYTIYENDQQIGTGEQTFNPLTLTADIKNNDGIVEWVVEKDIIAVTPQVWLTRQVENPTISALNALWQALMMHEIYASGKY